MSEFNDRNNPDDEPDALEAFKNATSDPVWRDLSATVIEINSTPAKHIDETVELLNTVMDEQGLAACQVSVTGKIRKPILDVYFNQRTNIFEYEGDIQLDKEGYYEYVTAKQSVSGYFVKRQDISPIYDDEEIVYALFEADDELNSYDTYASYYIRLEEIEQMYFDEMSISAIEEHLQYRHPDIYKQINERLPSNRTSPSYKKLINNLKNIKLLAVDEESTFMLERLIFSRMNLEEDVRVRVNGIIGSTDVNNKYVESDSNASFLLAHPQHVVLQNDVIDGGEEVNRPAIVFAVPSHADGDTYHMYIVPVESLHMIQSVKMRNANLGGQALMNYSDRKFSDAAKFYYDNSNIESDSKNISTSKPDNETKDKFNDILRQNGLI